MGISPLTLRIDRLTSTVNNGFDARFDENHNIKKVKLAQRIQNGDGFHDGTNLGSDNE